MGWPIMKGADGLHVHCVVNLLKTTTFIVDDNLLSTGAVTHKEDSGIGST